MKNISSKVLTFAFILCQLFTSFAALQVHAVESRDPMVGIMMSPMTEKLVLKAGESYSGSFWVINPEQNTVPITYTLNTQSFYRDEAGEAIFEDVEGRGLLAKWIKINAPASSTLAPSSSEEINYVIEVPVDAPAGGQYAAITATSASSDEGASGSAILKESIAMAHTIFVEVEGETIRTAEISNLGAPSFLLDGNIAVSSVVANTGNVHGTAIYSLEVYPLFSDEPIYTNVEDPEKKLILPNRKYAHSTTYEDTPPFGIFNIVYTVKFEGGAEQELKKLVIKMPIWLLLTIVTAIVCLVLFIIHRLKHRRLQVETSE